MLILYGEKIKTGSFIFKHCQYNQHIIVIAINKFIVIAIDTKRQGNERQHNWCCLSEWIGIAMVKQGPPTRLNDLYINLTVINHRGIAMIWDTSLIGEEKEKSRMAVG